MWMYDVKKPSYRQLRTRCRGAWLRKFHSPQDTNGRIACYVAVGTFTVFMRQGGHISGEDLLGGQDGAGGLRSVCCNRRMQVA